MNDLKRLSLFFILSVFWLTGCQDDTKDEKKFVIEDSIRDGDVILQETGQKPPLNFKIHNLDKLFALINKSNSGESAELSFINVTKDGKSVENKISTKDGQIIIDNNYLGMKDFYLTGAGETLVGLQEVKTYSCQNIDANYSGVVLTECEGEDDQFILMPYRTVEFREAKAKERIKN
ncbi:hypothetical protein [Fictibacillus halophilus]|uniref:hypothetical protein n=1 Tax=Fictibacillus halophilus TaxID=1610490 RepID=UPI001CFBBDD1|nr:hypothetical protein [Fictibacillus halophilus]